MSTATEEEGGRVRTNPPWIPDTDGYEPVLPIVLLGCRGDSIKEISRIQKAFLERNIIEAVPRNTSFSLSFFT